jgi:predicted DNA-binding transcriptional regulator YafY
MARMKSSERRMKLLLLLQESRQKLTVNDMAEQFEVSRRTIFRDLQALSEINVPVTWEPYSGYGIMPGYKIPPLMFTSRELATIMVGLNFVKAQIDKEMVEDAKGVELKIKHVLPDELKRFMDSLSGRTIVDPFLAFGPEKTSGGSWYLISSAISSNRSIRFTYTSKRSGSVSNRKVDPYLLVFYQDHWNLIGYSHKREDIRNFVINQMSEIEILEENFEKNEQLTAEALIYRFDGPGKEVVVEVDKSSFRRLESILPTKIIKSEGTKSKKIKVWFRFDNLPYINKWMLQFGDELKILDPPELKTLRNNLLLKMINK